MPGLPDLQVPGKATRDPPDVQSTTSVCPSVHFTEAQVWLLFCLLKVQASPAVLDFGECVYLAKRTLTNATIYQQLPSYGAYSAFTAVSGGATVSGSRDAASKGAV